LSDLALQSDAILMRRMLLGTLVAGIAIWLTGLAVFGADAAGGPRYKTGLRVIRLLGLDLYRAMEPKQRAVVNPEPVSVETDVTPFVKLAEYPEEEKPMRFVFVSVGFIDLMNNVAHAKAIDTVEKGYFEKYVLSLAAESGEKELKELPNVGNPKYWTEAVLNEQESSFNQMVGAAVAIKLSHHYLGHYKKYAGKLEDANGKNVPINTLLTPAEWDECMHAGIRNAMDAGMLIEGPKALFECIDKMPKRPDWTLYFLPAKANVKAIKKEMEKMERDFFAGK